MTILEPIRSIFRMMLLRAIARGRSSGIFSTIIAICISCFAPSSNATIYLGYEFGEMALNEFNDFAGEIGYKRVNGSTFRLVFLDIKLTERHLSSNESSAVSGSNIVGEWQGYEFIYDHSLTDNFQLGISLGRFSTLYEHTQLEESVKNKSNVAGIVFSYVGDDFLGIKDMYWRFSVPVRYYFNPMEETMLGESTVNENTIEVTPWIFVGFDF